VAPQIIDVALTEGNRLATYRASEGVYTGSVMDPLQDLRMIHFPEGQALGTIAGVGGELAQTRTATRTGSFWVLFSDGSIAEGRSYDFRGDDRRLDLGYRSITPE
jgi:hypothetical protein